MPTNHLKERQLAEIRNIDYAYDAQVEDVIDGDTYDLRLRLGFGIETQVRIRLRGVDTHEIFGGVPKESDEYQQGMAERRFVVEWLTEAAVEYGGSAWPLTVQTQTDNTGKYGRVIADVYRKSDGDSIRDALAAEYDDILDAED